MDQGPAAITSFTQLCEVLSARGIPHLADPTAQAVECAVQLPPLDGSLYLRWEKTVPILHLVYILHFDLPVDRLPGIATACCRANATLALPGFGIDYTRRTQYFRASVLVVDPLPVLALERWMLAVTTTARDFLPAFQRVIAGSSGGEFLNDHG